MEFPKILVRRYELERDSGGPGLHRGGLGIRRELEILEDGVLYTGLGDRHKIAPWGLEGGMRGGTGAFYRVTEDTAVQMGHKTTSLPLKKGDVIRVVTPGGGGFGDPRQRPAGQILRDVIEEKVSPDQARALYGCVIVLGEDGSYRVDEAETAKLRCEN